MAKIQEPPQHAGVGDTGPRFPPYGVRAYPGQLAFFRPFGWYPFTVTRAWSWGLEGERNGQFEVVAAGDVTPITLEFQQAWEAANQ